MSRKGLTLIELLAAVVILGLAMSLAATVISLITNASNRIEINSMANSRGLFLDREIKDGILGFGPTEYASCGTNCVTLQKEFTYVLNDESTDIVLFIYDPVLTHKIQIFNGQILINDVPIVIENFTLGAGSQIELIENLSQAYFLMTIELVASNGKVYTFTTSYSFTILAVPAS